MAMNRGSQQNGDLKPVMSLKSWLLLSMMDTMEKELGHWHISWFGGNNNDEGPATMAKANVSDEFWQKKGAVGVGEGWADLECST